VEGVGKGRLTLISVHYMRIWNCHTEPFKCTINRKKLKPQSKGSKYYNSISMAFLRWKNYRNGIIVWNKECWEGSGCDHTHHKNMKNSRGNSWPCTHKTAQTYTHPLINEHKENWECLNKIPGFYLYQSLDSDIIWQLYNVLSLRKTSWRVCAILLVCTK
jgi:hypothetical protein